MWLFLVNHALYHLDFTQTHKHTKGVGDCNVGQTIASLKKDRLSSSLPILSLSSCHVLLVVVMLTQCWWCYYQEYLRSWIQQI